MGQSILITGAAGGGAVIAELISLGSSIKPANISAVVRSEEQAQSLSELGVNVIQTDLSNEVAAHEAVLRNEIDIVVQAASMLDAPLSINLIRALGQRRESSGKATFFIHTSMTTLYTEEAGWPFGEVRDTDPVFEKQKQLGAGHPIRDLDIHIIEKAKALGVKSLIVAVPNVYGRGTGQWRKLSVSIPAFVRTSIKLKTVYKFDKDAVSGSPGLPWHEQRPQHSALTQSPPATHISDLASLYALLINKILQNEPIPTGEKGYYFAIAHRSPWWDVMQRLAAGLHARGLVKEPTPQIWPSYEMAAESLGFPLQHIRAIGTSSGQQVPVNAYQLGWAPKWDQARFLDSIDDEIAAVQELDTVKTTLFDSLLASQAK